LAGNLDRPIWEDLDSASEHEGDGFLNARRI
jgi:hypothetical protein